MEEADEVPEEASEPSVLSENQETKNGVSTQEVEEGPSVEVHEEFNQEPWESQPQEEVVEKSEKRMINLQRDLTTIVTNIQTAADAKESMRRTELEKARRDRLEQLENDVKSSQEIFEEINGGWSIAKQKVIPQELQEALNNQQQLCAALIEDKKKLINDLQQELKVGDDRYVKDLRKQAEELNLMMERMEDQIKTLTKAYREELAQIERVYHQESEVLLTRDKTEWEQHIKELWVEELERLTQRKKKVEEYEVIIHNLMLENTDKYSLAQTEQNAKFQVLDRKHQQIKVTNMITKLKQIKQKDEIAISNFSLAHMKNRAISLQTEMKNLITKNYSQKKQFTKKSRYLAVDYKRNIQQYERIKKKIKHFAVADARKFEEMWLMIEAEVKQLVERVLVIDSLICKQHLGLAWERPSMEFMELSGPIQPQKQAWRPAHQAVSQLFHTGQALQCSQRMMDLSVGPRLETDTESTDMEMYKEKTAVQSESSAEMEEGKLSMETQKKVMELLCDEAGFLIEDKLLNLLAPLEKEEQTVVKLGSLLCSFGIEEEDVPKLAHFLLKYKHQQREQTESVCDESDETSKKAEEVEPKSTTHLTYELIDPNHVVPALKSFLQQHMRSRESSAHQHHSFHVEARETSEDEAYWESIGIIISEDKLKLWDAVENTFKQYQAVLTEISELVPETQSLKQQNTELRMLLQQSLNSRVSTELEML
ncbi:dynein regulatory complex protein 1 isoform X2 [Sander lucioperca]|uniref:dynein regulatory complex protein 1 isoform X2 n=1 Tax=Sander lucioperca TaxID=283035 RepID=UPI0016538AFF|nr:dynein regulatory complex protein 1 isoform X2 [Sander lucioperca]